MAQGKGTGQVFQSIAAHKARLLKEIDNLDKLEKLIIDVYGKPDTYDFEGQDIRVMGDFVTRMFIKNTKNVEDARARFTNDSMAWINKLNSFLSRKPKGHEIIKEIERQYADKK